MADMTKITLYSCLALSALGGVSHAWLTHQREQADKDRTRALGMLQTISSLAADIQTLQVEKAADDWLQKSATQRHHEFFNTCALESGLPKGPSVGQPKDGQEGAAKGYTDTTYELTWRYDRNEAKGFDRERIAQFLWRVESRPLLRVTALRLTATDDTKWDDRWDPRVEVTERKPIARARVEE